MKQLVHLSPEEVKNLKEGDKATFRGRELTIMPKRSGDSTGWETVRAREPGGHSDGSIYGWTALTKYEEKKPRIPTWQRRLGISISDCPPVSKGLLVPGIALASKVRVICPERLEVKCRDMFDREGAVYPSTWRGCILGKRKENAKEMYSISATVWIPLSSVSEELIHDLTAVPFGEEGKPLGTVKDDFVVFNNFEYTMKLLVDGKAFGWRITESV